jgi:hypothetical protein
MTMVEVDAVVDSVVAEEVAGTAQPGTTHNTISMRANKIILRIGDLCDLL